MVKLNALNEPSKLFIIFRQNADKVVIANLDFDACPRMEKKIILKRVDCSERMM